MRIYAAPMEGLTTYVYRNTHRQMFGGVDRYFMPFFSPAAEHLLTARELRDLDPAHNGGTPVTPQMMTRRAEDFLWAVEKLRELGYREVNLNLGCPSGTVTAKGKGAGFLAHPAELDAFLRQTFAQARLPVSLKTRLGMRDEGEFSTLLDIYGRYPVCELIVHPRVREDYYKAPVRLEAFAAALPRIKAPVVYNGDLVTPEDVRAFARRFPQVETVMLGRGLMADPALARKLRGGPPAEQEELRAFTQTLYRGYREAYGHSGSAAQRMKELWFYLIHLFDGGEKYARRMRRVRTPGEYEELEAGIFRELPLRRDAAGPLV